MDRRAADRQRRPRTKKSPDHRLLLVSHVDRHVVVAGADDSTRISRPHSTDDGDFFDILRVVGLLGVKSKIPLSLFWAGLVCGILVLAIRHNGDASWWTGNLTYSVGRQTVTASAAKAPATHRHDKRADDCG
jgi:hypothetical protein